MFAEAEKSPESWSIADRAIADRIEFVATCLANRAGVRLIMSCMLAKIDNPAVDPREPITEIASETCFSGRSYDEQFLTAFITEHKRPYANQTQEVLNDPVLKPIRAELSDVCKRLEAEKENHGGKKQYHAMLAHYFLDLGKVWKALRRVVRPGGRACFVIGDSAPYGIYAPVERWLGELAVAAGFKAFSFEKLRDRNTKWKNRKHRVLLHEGRLWVEG
jgi:hypothetical protein